MFFDPLYLLFLGPALVLGLLAQWRVKSAMARNSEIANAAGLTGAQVARTLLDAHSVTGVRIEETDGILSDHYDPSKRVLRLSHAIYHGRSVTSAGVAAHEAGHAMQHQAAWGPLVFRQALAPMAIWGSNLSWILIMLGLFLHPVVAWIGVVIFSVAVVFTLVTLPVEFDASRRAKAALADLGLVSSSDREGVASVLNAAAMTYVLPRPRRSSSCCTS